jgi:hypothetical protein
LTRAIDRLVKETSEGTAKSTWNHLRTMLNHAAKVQAIDRAPKADPLKAHERKPRKLTDAEITDIYQRLAEWPTLQVAFVLALNIGPRTVDLFCLEWSRIEWGERPTITFKARKTSKEQTLPLNRTVVAHLGRLPSQGKSPWLFPEWTRPTAKDPEKSRTARARRAIISRVFAECGVVMTKPFQAIRVTCNSRLNTYRPGSGVFVLGHGLTLNARHYHDPTDDIFEACHGLPQPACFASY